ncbi:MAG: SRPBCC domain-containing protein [Pseudomonadota bacterium]
MQPIHSTFTVERICNASLATCWKAWTDPELKARWFVADIDGWETLESIIDVRMGGRERTAARDDKGVVHANETTFLNIVPASRIAFAYTMSMDDRLDSASLAVVTFEEDGATTKLTYTEQGAYFVGIDGTIDRTGGIGWLYDKFKQQVEQGQ